MTPALVAAAFLKSALRPEGGVSAEIRTPSFYASAPIADLRKPRADAGRVGLAHCKNAVKVFWPLAMAMRRRANLAVLEWLA